MKIEKSLLATLIALILIAFAVSFFGCSTQRKMQRYKTKYDSTVLKEKESIIFSLRAEKSVLEKQLKESQFLSIEFDSTKCPKIEKVIIPENCDSDSLISVIEKMNIMIDLVNSYNSKLSNRVTVLADGTISADGKLLRFSLLN
jgi:hypothetical protein